jgi:hypothetical protein
MARTARIESRRAQLAAERARIQAEAKAALARLAEQEAEADRELKAAKLADEKKVRDQARVDDATRGELLGRYLVRIRDSDDRKLYDLVVNALGPTLRRNGQRALFGLEPLPPSAAEPDDATGSGQDPTVNANGSATTTDSDSNSDGTAAVATQQQQSSTSDQFANRDSGDDAPDLHSAASNESTLTAVFAQP